MLLQLGKVSGLGDFLVYESFQIADCTDEFWKSHPGVYLIGRCEQLRVDSSDMYAIAAAQADSTRFLMFAGTSEVTKIFV